jgi:hypothetical protein
MEESATRPLPGVGVKPIEVVKRPASVGSVKKESFSVFFKEKAKEIELEYKKRSESYKGNKKG